MARIALLALVAALAAAAALPARSAAHCSASGMSAKLPAQTLPRAVATMRQRIVTLAVACDYTGLQRLGNQGQKIAFSYGKATSAAVYWKDLERRGGYPLATLVRILRLPVTRNEAKWYAWPSAYTEHPTARDWNLLVSAHVLTRKQADAERAHGSYLGYRLAIRGNGDWQFFIAGD
ncbi:MAG TPA: hypothetical protein VGU02_06190 [Gaiellaceae bacterium]|nr:hypothetical protein [Gaiellaceae bacterium]